MTDASIHEILRDLSSGKTDAADRLYPRVYEELRRIAGRHLGRERSGHTLQTTDLVHEAYLKLVDQHEVEWQGRAHFMAVAATAMRRILIDHARKKKADKRGGGTVALPLEEALHAAEPTPTFDLLALEDALARLGESQPEKARVVELRFFGGLKESEVAEVMGVSTRTIARYWKFAQAWLYREMRPGEKKAD